MTTFDTTDISYNVAWDEALWWEKVLKQNSASEDGLSARFDCQTFLLARSRWGAYSQASYNVDTGKRRDLWCPWLFYAYQIAL